jgi:hypothetical protein
VLHRISIATVRITGIALGLTLLGLSIPMEGQAIPAFARKEAQSCDSCHAAFPKLNETGMIYKLNGYRQIGRPGTNVWELDGGIPLALIVEIEAYTDPDIEIEEVELFGAGTLGKPASFFAEIVFDNHADPDYGPIWAQLNDLVGEQGNLNLRVGNFDIDLPFLSEARRVIRNSYIAHTVLDFFDDGLGAQVNGQLLGDPEANTPTFRYSAGVVRNDPDEDSKLWRGFGTLNATFADRHQLGVILRGGEEGDATDPNYHSVGALLAGETRLGDFLLTLEYAMKLEFRAQDLLYHNVMAEVLYLLSPATWVLGTRVDYLVETEAKRSQDWGLRFSALVRYNIVANLWAGAEYRHTEGGTDSPLTETNSKDRGLLFVGLGF